jgi:hypothetical protein
MAGEWIKMRADLHDDPAVFRLASMLGIDKYAVIGRLHTFWSWADRHSVDGFVDGAASTYVDEVVRLEGFAESLVKVGWLEVTDEGIRIPKFDRHNGDSAKQRALKNERQARWRAGKDAVVVEDVDAPPSTSASTREEKRREEKKEPKSKAEASASRLPADWMPTEGEISFCQTERPDLNPVSVASQFRDYWIAQPGAKGRKVDWPATWRNWVRNQRAAANSTVSIHKTTKFDAFAYVNRNRPRENDERTHEYIDVDAQRVA